MNLREIGLWNFGRGICCKSKFFQMSARGIAARLDGENKDSVHRVLTSLIEKGWVEITAPTTRTAGGWIAPAKLYFLSERDYIEKYPARCSAARERVNQQIATIKH
jgi:hypothetical protein